MKGVGQTNADFYITAYSIGFGASWLLREIFKNLFLSNSVRAKTKQFHLKLEGSHTALIQNNSRPKLNSSKYFGYYFCATNLHFPNQC